MDAALHKTVVDTLMSLYMTNTTEVEVGTTLPSMRSFQHMLSGLNMQDAKPNHTIDVIYTTVDNQVSYRATINNVQNVDVKRILESNYKSKSGISSFQNIVLNPPSGLAVSLLEKRKNAKFTKVLHSGSGHGLKLRVSEELAFTNNADGSQIKVIDKLHKSTNIMFRSKQRFTRNVAVGSLFSLNVDATIVASGHSIKELFDNMKKVHTYEIEIEITCNSADKVQIPEGVAKAFLAEFIKLTDLLSVSLSVSTSTSTSHSQSRSSHRDVDHDGVKPANWMLSNRQGFFDWMHDTFTYDDMKKNNSDSSQVSLFPHQKLVRDFMQFNSPYRGLLLFHGLGVGKTLSSIAAAEGFVRNHKKIIVMIPASLETNYRDEIIKISAHGNPSKKMWELVKVKSKVGTDLLFEYAHITTSTQSIWMPTTLMDLVPASKAEGLERGTSKKWEEMGEGERTAAKDTIQLLLNARYKFIRYNGISKSQLDALGDGFFKDSFIVIDEAHNFISRVVNGGNKSIARRMYTEMMESGSKIVLLTGTPIINHPYELSMLLNLARGPMPVYNISSSTTPLTHEVARTALEHKSVAPYVDQWFISPDGALSLSLLPQGYVNEVDWSGRTVVDKKHWKRGWSEEDIVEYAADLLSKSKPGSVGRGTMQVKVERSDMYAYPSKKEEFVRHFIDDSDIDNPRVKNMDLFKRRAMGLVSYYRSADEEYMPRVAPTVIEEVQVCDTQFNTYVMARDKERRMESSSKRAAGGLFASHSTVYRAFSRMACNFVFPKEIPRTFPNDIRLALRREITIVDDDEEKSASKEAEAGAQHTATLGGSKAKGCYSLKKAECIASENCDWIVGKGCKAKGVAPAPAPSPKQTSPKKESKGKAASPPKPQTKQESPPPAPSPSPAPAPTPKKETVQDQRQALNKLVHTKYEVSIERALRNLEKNGDKYLTVAALQNNYSSKLAKIYGHIDTCPGKALLYSQFRSVEGVGVTRLMLVHNGYAEVRLDANGIVNADKVLQPKYNGKRFIVFDGDRDKTRIMLQIFNGQFSSLPERVADQLRQHMKGTTYTNIRGDIVKLLMITQSGAEGISLKCVRRVLIMEPFWNKVRMDQVIGRAVRTGSHLELPLEDRSVEVFIYVSTFTPKQLQDNFTLRRLDNSITSDSHILQTAQKKDALIQEFLNALKVASIDCRNNASFNKPVSNGLSCYAFPVSHDPNAMSFTPSLEHDSNRDRDYESRLVRSRKVRGRVVVIDGKKYVRVPDFPDQLYDYTLYKDAGVLHIHEIKQN